jgi:hypothetical protein
MAVVGKVGTYATVQPFQGPDFGKMVKDQFDKIDAEEKAAKAAKAKADKEKQDKLDKLSLGDQETLNIDGFNVKRFEVLAKKRDRFSQLKKEGKLNEAQALIDDLSTEGNVVKQANATMKEIFENEGKYDPTYVSKAKDLITNLNSANVDVIDKGNGDIRYTIYADAEKTQPLEKEITVAQYLNKIRLPYLYEPTKEAKLFASTFKLDEIEKEINTSGKIGTIEAVDLMNSSRVLSRISKRAEDLTKDDRAMAHFGTTIDKFETRANMYTKEEKEAAKAYFEKNFKDAYAEKVDMSISQKRTGGSGSKDGLKIGPASTYEAASINVEGVGSRDAKGAKTLTIRDGKDTIKVGSMQLDRVMLNTDGRLYFSLSFSGSGKEALSGDGSSAGVTESNKFSKWYRDDSDEFDKLKTTYNAAFGKNLQTAEDLKNELFL